MNYELPFLYPFFPSNKGLYELFIYGREMFAIEKYGEFEASLEKAPRIAGVSISKMIDRLRENEVEANLV
jgi:hypothetical protein